MRIIIVGTLVLMMLSGCGKSDETIAKKAGNKVGETLTDFASGMGKGIDKKMSVQIELSKSIIDLGISNTVSKLDILGNATLSVYFISTKPYKGKFTAKALNTQGQEIGRASADMDLTANDAKYIKFAFHEEMDTQIVTKYTIDETK